LKVCHQIRRQDFYYCRTIERGIDDLVNSALSALADFLDDAIMEEELPDHRNGDRPVRAGVFWTGLTGFSTWNWETQELLGSFCGPLGLACINEPTASRIFAIAARAIL
jgi:hypothetical protein